MTYPASAIERLEQSVQSYDDDVNSALDAEERPDLWTGEVDVPVADLRALLQYAREAGKAERPDLAAEPRNSERTSRCDASVWKTRNRMFDTSDQPLVKALTRQESGDA